MAVRGAHERITSAVVAWEGVTTHSHRFGGTEYRLGRRELGHLHGDHLLDLPFPTRLRHEIVAAGLAEPHHLLVESGWVSFYLHAEGDIERAIALLRRAYDLAQAQAQRRAVRQGQPPR